ncbi:VAN3-binding protein-like protein [Tanacetum coccineum]
MVKAQRGVRFALNTLTQLAQAITSKNDSLAIRAKRDKGIVAAGVVNVYVRVPQLERLTHLWLKADQVWVIVFVILQQTTHLTAAAATALRGAATFKARALKEAWSTTVVIPVDRGVKVNKNNGKSNGYREDLLPEENLLGMCNQELLCLR